MRRGIALFLVISFLFTSGPASAYDLSHQSTKRRSRGPTTVALVPYAERSSVELDQLIDELTKKLRRTRGVRVLSQTKTRSLLEYYFSYVSRVSKDRSVHQQLVKAREALLAGDYQKASRLLSQTKRKIEKRVIGGGSNEGLYETYILGAKIHHAKGDEAGVNQAYDKIVFLNPDLELDPNLYSKWERVALKEAQEKIKDKRNGSIVVISSPEGGEVFLNGVHRGIAPLSLKDLPATRYCIEVKTVNHAPYIRYIDLDQGQSLKLSARLARTNVASQVARRTVPPSLYKTDLEISRLISTLGYHLGVDKVIMVTRKKDPAGETLVYQMGDTELGAVHRANQIALNPERPKQTVALAVNEMNGEARMDVLKNPSEIVDQSVGSVKLHEKRKKPFYKKPLFWILVGAGVATGGALGAILGAGGGAATGGVVIGI